MTKHRRYARRNLDLADDKRSAVLDGSHKTKLKAMSHIHSNKHTFGAKRIDSGNISSPSLPSQRMRTHINESLAAGARHQGRKGGESTTYGRRRRRRQLNPVLMYPGTKWCGNGNTAEAFDDLGSEAEADYCCREHDYCPFTIESFTRRFNLFNYRLHTLSHCQCDRRFRNCLKKVSSNSSITHLIGRIYFDFLGSRCFVFTKEKYCVERSWWGKCRTYGTQLTAKIKLQECY
ncbi:acidic phospholipase A2 PA4 [Octopus vulgaris]|uniref:phospholipase A2 n=1 Tax=Octopus vulgaris TaxID=6645 RepID=A0AA36EW38_OCTVU|nr:acidic phospholipase A2 PA4 [Octopus vulgaris]